LVLLHILVYPFGNLASLMFGGPFRFSDPPTERSIRTVLATPIKIPGLVAHTATTHSQVLHCSSQFHMIHTTPRCRFNRLSSKFSIWIRKHFLLLYMAHQNYEIQTLYVFTNNLINSLHLYMQPFLHFIALLTSLGYIYITTLLACPFIFRPASRAYKMASLLPTL
jgi:hypothetical protein